MTVKRHTYLTNVASMRSVYIVGVRGENREKAGVRAGDLVGIAIELDTEYQDILTPVLTEFLIGS
jgi:hypothetical protein